MWKTKESPTILLEVLENFEILELSSSEKTFAVTPFSGPD